MEPPPAVRVLTERSLLLHVVSFQYGVPSVVVPLLRRYRDEGRVTFDKVRGTFTNAQLPECPVLSEWPEHTMGEAIACYNDFDALKQVWQRWGGPAAPFGDREMLLHRLCDAACMFGRLEMLQWLYHTQRDVEVDMALTSLNVRACTIAGQLHVLEWLESLFPEHIRGLLREMNCVEAVKGGHVNVLRWLFARGLGMFPLGTMGEACRAGRLEVVQLLFEHLPRPECDEWLMLQHATRHGQLSIVQWLVRERHVRYPMDLVDRALLCEQIEVAEFLMTERHRLSPPITGGIDFMLSYELVKANKLRGLEHLVKVHERENTRLNVRTCALVDRCSPGAVALLLPVSPPRHASMLTVELVIKETSDDALRYLLEHASEHMHPAVVAFAERYGRKRLGPLAAMIKTAADKNATDRMDMSELSRALHAASGDDLRDCALLTSVVDHQLLELVLRLDLERGRGSVHVDVELLEVCKELCSANGSRGKDSPVPRHIAWRANLRKA